VGSFTPCERDAVRQALKRAGCLEAIELLPRGLDTEPQKEGLVLPSGLRQQILIAQTMLSRPALAIFDCADAQLDVAGAQGFMAVLNDLKADGTIIMLASQRPAILNLADIIARMDQGQVIAVEDRRTRAPALAAVPSHGETGAEAATSRAS
jgi:ATP-binding cassette subfamily B protein